jgi:hypothetical protein
MITPAFATLDWNRFDVWAIVECCGIAPIDERRKSACQAWLRKEDYEITSLDCSNGLARAITQLGTLLNWERQFGYQFQGGLDALRDGFEFENRAEGGSVLELVRPDILWKEDPEWLMGVLAIAQEYSRQQLAIGERFFALLVVPEGSPLIGQTIEASTVPTTFWNPCKDIQEFNS